MYPHRIRLRGPWECEPIDDGAAPPPRRVTMPCRWGEADLGGFRGLARFVRKFGYPGRIDDSEHVWITCAGCTGGREVHLNGHLLAQAAQDCFSFDVTALLTDRNRLEVLVHGDSDEAGLWGEVALEIRKSAYLDDLCVERTDPGLRVSGKATGTAPRPLELYTLVDDRHADYRTIQPNPAGQPFQIDLPGCTALHHTVRVELIDVSVIWYAAELPPLAA